jgi:hypothetical protein
MLAALPRPPQREVINQKKAKHPAMDASITNFAEAVELVPSAPNQVETHSVAAEHIAVAARNDLTPLTLL